jgi:hypothetical protein
MVPRNLSVRSECYEVTFGDDEVGLAVTKAVTNVVRHAYPGSIGGPIKLGVEALDGELEVIVMRRQITPIWVGSPSAVDPLTRALPPRALAKMRLGEPDRVALTACLRCTWATEGQERCRARIQ